MDIITNIASLSTIIAYKENECLNSIGFAIAAYNVLSLGLIIIIICLHVVIKSWEVWKSWYIMNSMIYIFLLIVFAAALANSCVAKNIIFLSVIISYTACKLSGMCVICFPPSININKVYNPETDQIEDIPLE